MAKNALGGVYQEIVKNVREGRARVLRTIVRRGGPGYKEKYSRKGVLEDGG